MTYSKFGPDALGRIVELPLVRGNVIVMPHRAKTKRPVAQRQILVFQSAWTAVSSLRPGPGGDGGHRSDS